MENKLLRKIDSIVWLVEKKLLGIGMFGWIWNGGWWKRNYWEYECLVGFRMVRNYEYKDQYAFNN